MTRLNIRDGSELKTGDTEPNFEAELVKNNGVPKDLTGYEVKFRMREANGDSLVVDDDTAGFVTVTDESLGRMSYDWQPADTETAATYEVEVEIDDGSGSVITFPNQGFAIVTIEEGLA